MTEENEVQIILTAVDNASEVIKNVNSALGGQTNTGTLPNGWVDPYANAAKEMEELSKQFNAAQNPIKKVGEAAADAGKKTDFLSVAIKGVGVVSPQASAQLNRLRSIATEAGPKFAAMGVSIGAIIPYAVAAAVAIGGIALALKAAGDAAKTTTADNIYATEEQIRIAEEYTAVLGEASKGWAIFTDIGAEAWRRIGIYAEQSLLGWKKVLDLMLESGGGFNFPTLGGTGFQQTQMPEEFQTRFAGGDFFQRYAEQAGFLSQSIEELNYVLGYSEDAFNKQTIAALVAKASLDGFVSPEESEYILGLAESLGILTEQEREAAQQAWNFQNIMLSIMDMPAEVRKKFILNVELFGSAAAIAAMQGMGQNLPQINTIPPESQFNWQQDDDVAQMMAGGGTAGIGDWAMVGDLPGGGILPTTEYVRANRGGGFTVFNQSQMAGKSAPPMASGGMVMPQSDEVTLSQQSIRDLADALAFKMSQVQ